MRQPWRPNKADNIVRSGLVGVSSPHLWQRCHMGNPCFSPGVTCSCKLAVQQRTSVQSAPCGGVVAIDAVLIVRQQAVRCFPSGRLLGRQ